MPPPAKTETRAGHTPGPWHRNIPPASHYSVIFSGRNTHVAQVVSRGLPAEQIEANADLIAAAPDLLAALKALLAAVEGVPCGPEEQCIAAVAKAEGRTK